MKDKGWKEYVRIFGPFVIIGIFMFFLFLDFIHNFLIVDDRLPGLHAAKFSLFPYTIPLLWFSYKCSEPHYETLASPYFYFHSIIPSQFLIANKNWKWRVAANIFTWVIFVLILSHMIPIKF